MSVIDEEHLLTNEEREAYQQLLKLLGYEPYHFVVEVTEDQGPMDMNDINYVIILKVKVIHVENNRSKTYISQLGSRTWISEFENDLLNGYY
jgi:hypothetical protein